MAGNDIAGGRRWGTGHSNVKGARTYTAADSKDAVVLGLIRAGDHHPITTGKSMAENSDDRSAAGKGYASNGLRAMPALTSRPVAMGRIVDAVNDLAQSGLEFDRLLRIGQTAAPAASDIAHGRIL